MSRTSRQGREPDDPCGGSILPRSSTPQNLLGLHDVVFVVVPWAPSFPVASPVQDLAPIRSVIRGRRSSPADHFVVAETTSEETGGSFRTRKQGLDRKEEWIRPKEDGMVASTTLRRRAQDLARGLNET